MQNAVYFGINPPFQGGTQNILSIQTDERLIKNDIMQMILTVPGERVYRPSFGTHVRTMVFENVSAADLSALEAEIIRQLAGDERIVTNNVSVTLAGDGSEMDVLVNVSPVWAPLTNYLIEIGITQAGQVRIIA